MTIANGSIFPRNGVPAGQAAPGADDDARATCDDLWYKASCNPRFDPQAMNSIMAELVNAVNRSCDPESGPGPAWDCSRQDNLFQAMCRHFDEKLFDCLTREFPDVGEACEIEQLVLARDASGCARIARYTAESADLGCASQASVWPNPTPLFFFPPNPADLNSYYNGPTLYADDEAGTIDQAKLDAGKLFRMEIEVPCDGTEIFLNGSNGIEFNPDGPNGIGMFAIRVDGEFITKNDVTMSLNPGFGRATNFESLIQYNTNQTFTLDAGTHVIESYWIGWHDNEPASQARIVNVPGSIGGGTCARVVVG